jgi:hypothetical protein
MPSRTTTSLTRSPTPCLQNGYLMSWFAAVRAIFLTSAFPKIIKYGRRWSNCKQTAEHNGNLPATSRRKTRPLSRSFQAPPPRPIATGGDNHLDELGPIIASTAKQTAHPQDTGFDLVFLRWSMLINACLTGKLAFAGTS